MTVKFVILGKPITKKNSLRVLRGKNGKPFVAQSKAHGSWEQTALLQLQAGWQRWRRAWDGGHGPIDVPINMRAVVYRDRDVGDLLNFLAAVSDALEGAGVVVNDKFIQALDGSRLALDRKNPRVEIELTPLAGGVA